MHELRHVLGYEHAEDSDLMDALLPLSTRRLIDDDLLPLDNLESVGDSLVAIDAVFRSLGGRF
jgi:hypothetical protein